MLFGAMSPLTVIPYMAIRHFESVCCALRWNMYIQMIYNAHNVKQNDWIWGVMCTNCDQFLTMTLNSKTNTVVIVVNTAAADDDHNNDDDDDDVDDGISIILHVM